MTKKDQELQTLKIELNAVRYRLKISQMILQGYLDRSSEVMNDMEKDRYEIFDLQSLIARKKRNVRTKRVRKARS